MPISRYQNFGTFSDLSTGKKRLETFPPIAADQLRRPDDIVIELNDSQRIDAIAAEHLGDGRYWWVICLLNNMVFPFGKNLRAGTLVSIPASIDVFINTIQRKLVE